MSIDAILNELAALSAAERIEFRTRFDEQFANDEVALSPDLVRLLEERVRAADANPGANVPWDVVYAESLKRTRT